MSQQEVRGSNADTLVIPKRKIAPARHEETSDHSEYIEKIDAELKTARKHAKRHRYTFILKYIGAWYIVLSIFKGLYGTFSPSFDIIGLALFLTGFIWERVNTRKAEHEIQERWADRDHMISGGSI